MLTAEESEQWDSPVGEYLGHGTYIGPALSTVSVLNPLTDAAKEVTHDGVPLKAKTAIARSTGLPERVALQFDDTTLREAYGWWVYPAKHFLFDLE